VKTAPPSLAVGEPHEGIEATDGSAYDVTMVRVG